jgi:hypothetical protein
LEGITQTMEMSIKKDVNTAIPFFLFIDASLSRSISSLDIDPHQFIWNESEYPTPGVLHQITQPLEFSNPE